MITPLDHLLYVAFRTFYTVRPPRPLGTATLTVYTGDGTERLAVKGRA